MSFDNNRPDLAASTLATLVAYFSGLYGERNARYMPELSQRINFLCIAVGDLLRAHDRGYGDWAYQLALARIVPRVFAIQDYFVGSSVDLVEALRLKFPVSGCGYCGENPCRCQVLRSPHTERELDDRQLTWSLADWQKHFAEVYGGANCFKTFHFLACRLMTEATEMMSLDRRLTELNKARWRPESARLASQKEVGKELADILAWTVALANWKYVGLEEVVLSRYGNGCWNCNNNPCLCGDFNFTQVDWEEEGRKLGLVM